MSAYGLELYNEDLRDLAVAGGRDNASAGWDGKGGNSGALKLQERPTGKDGRVVPEVGAWVRGWVGLWVPAGHACMGSGP